MMFSFAGTLACFITEEWELVDILVGFKALAIDEHKGEHAAHVGKVEIS
jgi:hypothetical protein